MFFPLFFITLAFVGYTLSVWSERFYRNLTKWMVVVFVCGFSCDLLGTGWMWFRSDSHIIRFHSICGYMALGIMFLHLIWALLAYHRNGLALRLFSRYSLTAWLVWLIAFISGTPKI